MTRTATPQEILAHADALRRLALVLVRDAATADDALQETLLRALQSPPRQGPTTRAWLSTVLRNIVRKGWQGQARRKTRECLRMDLPAAEAPDQRLERIEQAQALLRALGGLPVPKREVIELRFFEGLPPRAIAQRLGLPVETVKTRQKRALASLRLALDHTEGRSWPVVFAAGFGMTPGTLLASGSAGYASVLGAASMSKLSALACLVGLLLLSSAALWVWSSAARRSPERGLAAKEGSPASRPPRGPSAPRHAPALRGLAGDADAAPQASADEPEATPPQTLPEETRVIAGDVLLVDPQGAAVPVEDGMLRFVIRGANEGSELEIPVSAGRFTAQSLEAGEPQFRVVVVGGEEAIVFEAERQEPGGDEGRYTVKARVFADTVIRVVDARTGEELPEVFLQEASYQNRNFPHPGLLLPSMPTAVASPIRHPATFERIDRRDIVYRLGAPGYAWTSLAVVPRAGREYTVRLVAGGSLALTVAGPALPRKARVRIRRVRARRTVASYRVLLGGELRCEGLAPEQYMARVEVGEWFDNPIILGQVKFEILAGRRSEARLEYKALDIPKSVPLAGEVRVPDGWPLDQLQMTIELLDTPLIGQARAYASFSVGRGLEPVPGQPRRFRFNAGQQQSGRYQISFRSYQYHIGLHLGEEGEPALRVDVPPRVRVRVEIEGDVDGRTSHLSSLQWHCVVPRGVSMWSVHDVQRSGPKVAFEFHAPATAILVSAGERAYYAEPMRIDVTNAGTHATLRVHPTCLLWIRAMAGDKQVRWDSDWPIRITGLIPEGKALARGQESGRHFCDLSRPGRYRISLGRIPDYAPIPDLEIEVGLDKPTELRVDLQPLR